MKKAVAKPPGRTKALSNKRRKAAERELLDVETILAMSRELLEVDFEQRDAVLRFVLCWGEKLFASRPWLRYEEHPFEIDMGPDVEPIIAHFTGGLGKVIGCNVYPRARSYRQLMTELETVMALEVSDEAIEIRQSIYAWACESLFLTIEPRLEVPPADRKELETILGVKAGPKILYPWSKRSGFSNFRASRQELIFIAIGLFGLANRMMIPLEKADEQLALRLEEDSPLYDLLGTVVQNARGSLDGGVDSSKRSSDPLGSSGDKLKKALREARPSESTWEIGFAGSIGSLEAKQGFPEPLMIPAIVVDRASGMVLSFELCQGGDAPGRALAKILLHAIRSTRLRPASLILFDSILSETLLADLSGLDLPIEVADDLDMFCEAALALRHNLDRLQMEH